MKIVVLAGGLSPERDVSLSSGTRIARALRKLGHRAALTDLYFGLEAYDGPLEAFFDEPIPDCWEKVSGTPPDLDAVRRSRKWESRSQFGWKVLELCQAADIVFLGLHGACGEDGRVQATFDMLGIPYTGSGYLASGIALDKDFTKRIIAGLGVATPVWRELRWTSPAENISVEGMPLPCVVKPADSGSSLGVTIARTREELYRALEGERRRGGRSIVEQYIAGRDIQVGILGDQALPSIEIVPKAGFYDYNSKYQPGAAREITPSPIPPRWEQAVEKAALTVYRALELSVYARADFILDEAGTPWFLEINTLPGMTPTSLVPQEAAAVGIDYPELCRRILEESLRIRGRRSPD